MLVRKERKLHFRIESIQARETSNHPFDGFIRSLVTCRMFLTLKLFGELRRHSPAGERVGRAVRAQFPDGLTAQQLVIRLGIPYGGDEGQMVIAVNDREVDHGTTLRDGDVVSLFEPLAGG